MIDRAHGLMTADEFFELGNDKYIELVRGWLRLGEPPGGLHGVAAGNLSVILSNYVKQHRLGRVLIETGYILQRDPDTVRGPDVSFINRARIERDPITVKFIAGPPDLAVEILSPSNRKRDVAEKLTDYFAAGTRLAWVVDPSRRRVLVYHSAGEPSRIVEASDVLDGEDVVLGFTCKVEELFEL